MTDYPEAATIGKKAAALVAKANAKPKDYQVAMSILIARGYVVVVAKGQAGHEVVKRMTRDGLIGTNGMPVLNG